MGLQTVGTLAGNGTTCLKTWEYLKGAKRGLNDYCRVSISLRDSEISRVAHRAIRSSGFARARRRAKQCETAWLRGIKTFMSLGWFPSQHGEVQKVFYNFLPGATGPKQLEKNKKMSSLHRASPLTLTAMLGALLLG